MFYINLLLFFILTSLCICDGTPYLLRSYPTESIVQDSSFGKGPCKDLLDKSDFYKDTDESSYEKSQCSYDSSESLLVCKLGTKNASATVELDSFPLNDVKVLVLFVQEFLLKKVRLRVLDLCFLGLFGSSLKELAVCGYQPKVDTKGNHTALHILDVPTLAIFHSSIETLLVSGVDIWQSIEFRQFTSLKHLLIIQGYTVQMRYYHSPLCADCLDIHPISDFSFHYLIPLSYKLSYFLYDSPWSYKKCSYDLLKKIHQANRISTFIIASSSYSGDKDAPICDTCASGLCPLLAVCLDSESKLPRKTEKGSFDCLCVEDVIAEDEFSLCDPMSVHLPMYSTRCNHTPSFWNYLTLPIIIFVSYLSSSFLVFLFSTIFLCGQK